MKKWSPVLLVVAVLGIAVFLNLGPSVIDQSHGKDKMAHFAFYAVLVVFFWKFMGEFSLALVSVLATLFEYLQRFVPNRNSNPYDLLSSLAGALAGFYLMKTLGRMRDEDTLDKTR